jgi:hypothetical protein
MEFDISMIDDAKKTIRNYLLGYHISREDLLIAAQVMTYYECYQNILSMDEIKKWCGANDIQV